MGYEIEFYETENSMNLDQFKAELLKNPEIQTEYEALSPEYDLMRQIIKARIDQNMTQKQLAEKVGTKQSSIARLESGNYNPSYHFLQKIAEALGKKLTFSLQ